MRFKDLGDAGNVTTSTYACDDGIQTFGEVRQNFQRGGAGVNLYVGWVFKLLGNPCAWRGIRQFLGPRNRPFHAFFAWS